MAQLPGNTRTSGHSVPGTPGVPPRAAASLLILSLCGAASAIADPCPSKRNSLRAKVSADVEYSARVFEAGHQFSIEGVSYELIRTQFTDPHSQRQFAVTYPVLVDARNNPDYRDFFITVETRESSGAVCNDFLLREALEQTVESGLSAHPVSVQDESDSMVRFGDLDKTAKRLVSVRTLAATMRARLDGTEMTVATGFTAHRSLNISDCARSLDDSYGFVEYQPGMIKVTCFPADPQSRDYVDEIDWRVDYQWPQDAPALLDELIDYVYIDALRSDTVSVLVP